MACVPGVVFNGRIAWHQRRDPVCLPLSLPASASPARFAFIMSLVINFLATSSCLLLLLFPFLLDFFLSLPSSASFASGSASPLSSPNASLYFVSRDRFPCYFFLPLPSSVPLLGLLLPHPPCLHCFCLSLFPLPLPYSAGPPFLPSLMQVLYSCHDSPFSLLNVLSPFRFSFPQSAPFSFCLFLLFLHLLRAILRPLSCLSLSPSIPFYKLLISFYI